MNCLNNHRVIQKCCHNLPVKNIATICLIRKHMLVDINYGSICFSSFIDPYNIMSNIWIYVISCVRPALCCLLWQKLSCWTLHTDFVANFFHSCHAYGHPWPLPVYTIFSDFTVTQGHRVSRKQILLSLFSCILFNFQDEMLYDVEAVQGEQFKMNTIRFLKFWEITCFADCIQTF